MIVSDPFFGPVNGIVSNDLAFGAEQLRGRYFFVSDGADGYFVNSPLEWGLRFY